MTPSVLTIPPHRAFADALAAGLLARHGGDPLGLARGLVLLPNNRAQRAVADAFVRRSAGGLLLPRLVAIGDPALDEQLGPLLDPIDDEPPVPPAIEPVRRRLILARLVAEARDAAGRPVEAGEAMRLAGELGRTLDQLIVEDVPPARLAEAVPAELAAHWQASLELLTVILERWPRELAARGRIDLAERRNRLLARAERRWAEVPPPGFVVAAGISVAAPAVARLLRRVARLERGMVVLPGLDAAMPEPEWQALDGERPIETHPQFHLKQLLDRIGVARGEVRRWPHRGASAAPAARSLAIGNLMKPPDFTDAWETLPRHQRRLSGVRTLTLAGPGEEAQAIAVAIREAVATPGRTVALVTPDRDLAVRVAAHCARWGIAADDSAGRPLSLTPPGTLLRAIAEAAAEGFAPVPLLALLKHPLVRAGDGRLAWLDGVRGLDEALRGPRPASGLAGIGSAISPLPFRRGDGGGGETRSGSPGAERRPGHRAPSAAPTPGPSPEGEGFWNEVVSVLKPLETAFRAPTLTLANALAAIREAAQALAGDAAWSRPAGRAAADLVADLEAHAGEGPGGPTPDGVVALMAEMLAGVAVRPPQGGHPRVFIWGLIEARLQHADLMILGGLNEGVWPGLPAPDPWLAPAVRKALGLPGLERRIGIEAHEFAEALGAPEVLVTRARRDARAPTVASRFWLRLAAMTGGLPQADPIRRWADALDRPAGFHPAEQPQPAPPVADRPRRIAVTKLDRLQADPFAFYADAMLKLRRWDAVDADPTPAWRGSAVHAVFEAWMKEDGCDPARLHGRAEAMLAAMATHPVMKALWTPRLIEAIDWAAGEMAAGLAAGRRPLVAERKGWAEVAGIRLEGTVDRIDRLADGGLVIVDYKTGKPPSPAAVAAGYAMQLGLLGLIAERGGFGAEASGVAKGFEYWSLAASRGGTLGFVESPCKDGRDDRVPADAFTAQAARILEGAVVRWLAGAEPFTAKLHPEYAPYGDYDQLMRLDEWYGRRG